MWTWESSKLKALKPKKNRCSQHNSMSLWSQDTEVLRCQRSTMAMRFSQCVVFPLIFPRLPRCLSHWQQLWKFPPACQHEEQHRTKPTRRCNCFAIPHWMTSPSQIRLTKWKRKAVCRLYISFFIRWMCLLICIFTRLGDGITRKNDSTNLQIRVWWILRQPCLRESSSLALVTRRCLPTLNNNAQVDMFCFALSVVCLRLYPTFSESNATSHNS